MNELFASANGREPRKLMTLKYLPPTFCWTRIGLESGEHLPTVVLRKEWERRLGGGRFLWGIGQSLGTSAQVAAHRTGSLLALFSPASGRSRPLKGKLEEVLLWNAWIDNNGQVRPLPPDAFITSRALLPSGQPRKHYYALVCSSPTELSIGSSVKVYPEHLRHVSTLKVPGSSLSAAVVDCIGRDGELNGKSYPVALAVELEAPYFVRLAEPVLLRPRELAPISKASREGDFETCTELVRRLRTRPSAERTRGFTQDLFDMPQGEPVIPFHGQARGHTRASYA
jgi:hypothetical protein